MQRRAICLAQEIMDLSKQLAETINFYSKNNRPVCSPVPMTDLEIIGAVCCLRGHEPRDSYANWSALNRS